MPRRVHTPIPCLAWRGPSRLTASSRTKRVANGKVTKITIINAGCCYTSLPRIIIASPRFAPFLSIRTSKVVVTQNVVGGGVVALGSMRKPRAELTLSLLGFEPNKGQIKAIVVVSNRSPRTLVFRIRADTSWTPPIHYNTRGPFTLRPANQAVVQILLPGKENKVVAGALRDYSSRFGELWRWYDSMREEFFDYYSLDFP